MNQRTLLNAEQVSEILGITVPEVWRLSRAKKLPSIVLGRRTLRFDPADVEAFINRNRKAPAIDWNTETEIPF